MSLADKFNLLDGWNVLRIICGAFFLPHIYGKFFATDSIGFFTAAIKEVADTRVGDTITEERNPTAEPLPDFKEAQSVVFAGFFPVDAETIRFLKATGRKSARIALVEKYAKAQGLFHTKKSEEPVFTDTLHLDLSTVEPSMAGPRRPQDRVALSKVGEQFGGALIDVFKKEADAMKRVKVEGTQYTIGHGDVVIAANTSCTNSGSGPTAPVPVLRRI